jgi:hypothetical protein
MVILGFYDNGIPEDKLRNRPFYRRRWLKTSVSIIQSDSTPAFNSFNRSLSTISNDVHSMIHFPGIKTFFFSMQRLILI